MRTRDRLSSVVATAATAVSDTMASAENKHSVSLGWPRAKPSSECSKISSTDVEGNFLSAKLLDAGFASENANSQSTCTIIDDKIC